MQDRATSAAKGLPLEDIIEIQTLLNRFNLLFDEGNGDGVASLFTGDGSIASGNKIRANPKEISDYVLNAKKRQTHRHFTTNVVVDPVPDDPLRATSQACFLYLTFDDEGRASPQSFGTYVDDLVKQDGRWLIQRRTNLRAEPNQ